MGLQTNFQVSEWGIREPEGQGGAEPTVEIKPTSISALKLLDQRAKQGLSDWYLHGNVVRS